MNLLVSHNEGLRLAEWVFSLVLCPNTLSQINLAVSVGEVIEIMVVVSVHSNGRGHLSGGEAVADLLL